MGPEECSSVADSNLQGIFENVYFLQVDLVKLQSKKSKKSIKLSKEYLKNQETIRNQFLSFGITLPKLMTYLILC